MHELSAATNIIDVVRRSIPPEQQPLVRSIHVRIGEQAGIVIESLKFCFEAAKQESPLNGASLSVDTVPMIVSCAVCGSTGAADGPASLCPACGGSAVKIVSGTGMDVVGVEIEA